MTTDRQAAHHRRWRRREEQEEDEDEDEGKDMKEKQSGQCHSSAGVLLPEHRDHFGLDKDRLSPGHQINGHTEEGQIRAPSGTANTK